MRPEIIKQPKVVNLNIDSKYGVPHNRSPHITRLAMLDFNHNL
jgi:hypothetical protein